MDFESLILLIDSLHWILVGKIAVLLLIFICTVVYLKHVVYWSCIVLLFLLSFVGAIVCLKLNHKHGYVDLSPLEAIWTAFYSHIANV